MSAVPGRRKLVWEVTLISCGHPSYTLTQARQNVLSRRTRKVPCSWLILDLATHPICQPQLTPPSLSLLRFARGGMELAAFTLYLTLPVRRQVRPKETSAHFHRQGSRESRPLLRPADGSLAIPVTPSSTANTTFVRIPDGLHTIIALQIGGLREPRGPAGAATDSLPCPGPAVVRNVLSVRALAYQRRPLCNGGCGRSPTRRLPHLTSGASIRFDTRLAATIARPPISLVFRHQPVSHFHHNAIHHPGRSARLHMPGCPPVLFPTVWRIRSHSCCTVPFCSTLDGHAWRMLANAGDSLPNPLSPSSM